MILEGGRKCKSCNDSQPKEIESLISLKALLRFGRKHDGPWSEFDFPDDTDENFIKALNIILQDL